MRSQYSCGLFVLILSLLKAINGLFSCINLCVSVHLSYVLAVVRGTQRQFSENICSEDDLRYRIFETFVVKFPACLPLLGFSNI